MKARFLIIPILVFSLASCGDDDTTPASPDQPGQAPTATPSPSPTPSPTATPSPTPTPTPTPTATVTVTIPPNAMNLGSAAYVPSPVTITLGTTVTWVNNDSVPHTVTSTTDIWDSGIIAPGETFSRVFNETGELPYFCTLHPTMTGIVRVGTPGTAPTPSPTFDDNGDDNDNDDDNGGGNSGPG